MRSRMAVERVSSLHPYASWYACALRRNKIYEDLGDCLGCRYVELLEDMDEANFLVGLKCLNTELPVYYHQPGTIVWVKDGEHPWWPAKISEPGTEPKGIWEGLFNVEKRRDQ